MTLKSDRCGDADIALPPERCRNPSQFAKLGVQARDDFRIVEQRDQIGRLPDLAGLRTQRLGKSPGKGDAREGRNGEGKLVAGGLNACRKPARGRIEQQRPGCGAYLGAQGMRRRKGGVSAERHLGGGCEPPQAEGVRRVRLRQEGRRAGAVFGRQPLHPIVRWKGVQRLHHAGGIAEERLGGEGVYGPLAHRGSPAVAA
jgi:hypothetical protein